MRMNNMKIMCKIKVLVENAVPLKTFELEGYSIEQIFLNLMMDNKYVLKTFDFDTKTLRVIERKL